MNQVNFRKVRKYKVCSDSQKRKIRADIRETMQAINLELKKRGMTTNKALYKIFDGKVKFYKLTGFRSVNTFFEKI